MDALLAVLIPVLPELGIGSTLFAFAIWRERSHSTAAALWVVERTALVAEMASKVEAERKRIAEDDARKDQRIGSLVAENTALELQVDTERTARRAAEDRAAMIPQIPRHRQEGA